MGLQWGTPSQWQAKPVRSRGVAQPRCRGRTAWGEGSLSCAALGRGEKRVSKIYSGMPATALERVTWQKSRRSNSQGNCVEMAKLPGDEVAVRNSRHPNGPALVYTRAEIEALILGAKDGDFDNLLQ